MTDKKMRRLMRAQPTAILLAASRDLVSTEDRLEITIRDAAYDELCERLSEADFDAHLAELEELAAA